MREMWGHMRIKVVFHGILADWVGTEETNFVLREGSCLGDLLATIGKRYGRKMPEQLWDKEKEAFVQAVWAMQGTQRIIDCDEVLKEGEAIKFLLMQAGG